MKSAKKNVCPSLCKHFTFLISFVEPLGQILPNFKQSILIGKGFVIVLKKKGQNPFLEPLGQILPKFKQSILMGKGFFLLFKKGQKPLIYNY